MWDTVLSHTDCDEEDEYEYQVWTPTTKYQLHGITRANVLHLCAINDIPIRECDFTLTTVYSAEEAFVTGTFAGVIPVTHVRSLNSLKWIYVCYYMNTILKLTTLVYKPMLTTCREYTWLATSRVTAKC